MWKCFPNSIIFSHMLRSHIFTTLLVDSHTCSDSLNSPAMGKWSPLRSRNLPKNIETRMESLLVAFKFCWGLNSDYMRLLINMFASEIFNQTCLVTGTPTFAFAAMSESWGAQIWSHTGQRNVWPRYDGQMTQQKGPNFHWTHKAKKRICKTQIVIVAMFTKSQERQRHSVAGESPLKVDPLLRKITIRLGTGRASGSSSRHREGSREVAACFTGPLKRLQKMEFWPVHHQNHQESSSSWDSTLVQKNN